MIHNACSFIASNTSRSHEEIPETEVLQCPHALICQARTPRYSQQKSTTRLSVFSLKVKTSTSVPSIISPKVKQQIQALVTHLARDLVSQDKHDETCLHPAAEYSVNRAVLGILLDLDRIFDEWSRVQDEEHAWTPCV